ncbi:hypothetical protein GCM10011492_06110 [Flexivirga endophytica]|uniref:Uncharacterized protein n=1 Tax=Flexivirga endophytica TaxID=1849103 RepID=A0A916SVP3_9MICO|nr:nuclear transport factor 2 family protein [Flexivirga endophytica]GGB19009.1 hypothetical protein GCM10011492_06110 [Flexivirga endophytica]GHB36641.1 hypothetical protein GCM10008112_01490 [Flexivirga endophytica]
MNTNTIPKTTSTTRPPVNGELVHALSCRDFRAFERCLADDAHLRALVPSGPFELDGGADIAARFETWFGGADDFVLLEASAGSVGAKRYLRWRIRLSPPGHRGDGRVTEQHLFTTGHDKIETIDLLCSGFQHEQVE